MHVIERKGEITSLFRSASISCTGGRNRLTHSLIETGDLALEFSHHPSRILSGENICLVSLVILRNLQFLLKFLAFCSASLDGF